MEKQLPAPDLVFVSDLQLEAMGLGKAGTWRHRRLRGIGPSFYKVGRNVKYNLAEVQDWLAERSVLSKADKEREKRLADVLRDSSDAELAAQIDHIERALWFLPSCEYGLRCLEKMRVELAKRQSSRAVQS
jgi:hypothetical protein